MILPVVKYPDPRLLTPARSVDAIDERIRQLVSDMVETMYAEPGIGLAANQVGELDRVAVVDLSVGEDPGALIVLINPEIVATEGEQDSEEGCLSFPGLTVKIKRPERVTVRATDLEGKPYTLEAGSLLARALCHEIDHLGGTVFIDHLKGLAKQMALTNIKRLKRKGLWDAQPGAEPAGSSAG